MVNWSFILLLLVIAFAFWSFWRRKPHSKPNLEKAIGLLNDISFNLRLIAKQANDPKPNKKFKTYNWNLHKDKLEFLDQELARKIKLTFALILDYNSRFDSAIKKRETYLIGAEGSRKLEGSLIEIKAELIEWLKED